MAAILNKEPKPLSSEVPTEISKIISKCLRKNRDERYQTIKDVLIDLKDVKQDLEFQDKLERSIVPNKDENKTQILQVTTGNESHNQTITNAVGKSGNRKVVFAVGSIILLALIGFGVYRFLNPSKTTDVATFEKIKNVKMTKSGKVISTAISPDGKYFAHNTSTDGMQTLFVRQTSANNDITVVPTAKVEYWGITFSKDSEYLFYSVRDDGGIAILYRIPALGGTPQKIIEGVDCPVTFSPDGKQMAFVRGEFPSKGESVLIIANSDGTGEKALATRKEPERFYPNYFTGPSWSPDGKMIAASVAGIGTNLHSKIIGFNVSDGKETEITKQEWGYIGRVEWLADGKGLMMIARDFAATFQQLWHLSYPNGEARKITNEFKDYRGLSLNADSSKVVTGQTDRMIGVWVAPASNLNQATQILPPNSEGFFVSWTPDGKFLYFNDTAGNSNIGTMEADGSGQRELTSSGNNLIPTISPDGSRIVFESNPNGSSGASIWIMNRDGSNPKQLTTGLNERNPVFSADGKWVIYTSNTKETMGLWKISVEGGNPVRIADGRYFSPWVSPDGKFIAAFYLEKATTPEQNPNKIAILPIDGGVPLKTFDIQYNPTTGVFVGWSADSKNVIYNQVKDNISNLWSQPISGGQPKQISDFKEGLIYDFDLSHDGKQFVISRGPFSRDAVLISNEK